MRELIIKFPKIKIWNNIIEISDDDILNINMKDIETIGYLKQNKLNKNV